MKKALISIIHIFPGPIYDAEFVLEKKFKALSKFSYGTVVSLAVTDLVFTIGNFKIVMVGTNNKFGIKQDLLLLRTIVKEAALLRRTNKLDLVICYDPLKTGLLGLLVKKINKCKLIVEVNGVYSSPELYKSNGIKTSIKKRVYPRIQQYVIHRANALKCLFEGQLEGFDVPDNVATHYFFDFTPIDVSEYKADDQRTILTIGFPSHIKGIDLLITAFKCLQSDFSDWKLMIVGHFSTLELEQFSKLIDGDARIAVKKSVNFSDIPKLIDSCDIFVLASRTEAMGRVLLESMARGKSRIGSRVGGIPTVINHGEDGLLFEANNAEDLKLKMRTLMESEPERRKLAESGLNRFKQEFTVVKYGEYVNALYNDVINSIKA